MAQIYQLHESKNKKNSKPKKNSSRKPQYRAGGETETREHRSRNSYAYYGFDVSLI